MSDLRWNWDYVRWFGRKRCGLIYGDKPPLRGCSTAYLTDRWHVAREVHPIREKNEGKHLCWLKSGQELLREPKSRLICA
jgi:hypothetical protein